MGKNVAVGSKKPNKLDRQTRSATLPPLPKMYQMGIVKGTEIERERIVKLLTDFDNEQYYEWLKSDDKNWPAYAEVAIGFRLAIALIKEESN
jgi:hypothetical protein